MPVMLSIQPLIDGRKTATLTVSVASDRYQRDQNGLWYLVHDLQHGDGVQAVSHFGRHFTRVGTVTTIRSLETNTKIDMLITEIIFVEVARLTDQDIADLGYATRQDWALDWGDVVKKRHGWFVRLIPVRSGEESSN